MIDAYLILWFALHEHDELKPPNFFHASISSHEIQGSAGANRFAAIAMRASAPTFLEACNVIGRNVWLWPDFAWLRSYISNPDAVRDPLPVAQVISR